MIGTYDLLASSSLTSRSGIVLHGTYNNTDPIVQMIQWTSLNWNQVHHGHLPLWNPYNGLGLPLAFNWQAASFGVPSLVGYLLPLRFAYTAGVVLTLVIAGTGAYVLARVLRVGFLGAIMAASVFELGGPLIAWLGYPQSQVLSWGGWLIAAGVLVVRGRHRILAITLFALVLACSIYAGHPETLTVIVGSTLVFLIVVLVVRALPTRLGFEGGAIGRPVVDLGAAMAAGLALGAPLLLPGLQLSVSSIRTTSGAGSSLLTHDLLYLIFASFDGMPVAGGYGFGPALFYDEVSAYVGVIAIVLAVLAIVIGVRKRRPEVLSIGAVAVVMAAVAYVAPVTRLADTLPLLGEIDWSRALMPLSLALAILAGMGLDAVVRSPTSSRVRLWLLGGFGGAALLLGGIWLFGRAGGIPSFEASVAVHLRAESFVWPVVGVGVGIAGALLLWWRTRSRLVVAAALIVCEASFLIAVGSIQIASSTNGYPPTSAVSALQRAVGSAIVATDPSSSGTCTLGITPEANIAYQVHELDLYDPIVPKAYFTTWQTTVGTRAGYPIFDLFCPAITTASEARNLGVGYVLVPSGKRGPSGGVYVTELNPANPYPPGDRFQTPPSDEDLYRIPGAASATVVAIHPGRPLPPSSSPGQPVPVNESNPARWIVKTDTSTAAVLRLHLTDVPGWHATIDGRPLQLESRSTFILQARIPPGRHVIELSYWPTAFTVGLVLALVTALGLTVAVGAWLLTRRNRLDLATSETDARDLLQAPLR